MNLITEYLENSFEIKPKTINTLVIEDTKLFSNFLRGIIDSINKKNEDFELIYEYKKLELSKVTDIVFDIFSLGANNSTLLKKLYSELEQDLNSEDLYAKKIEMESTILKMIEELLYRSRFSLNIGDISYQNLFKAIGIEFVYDETSLIERITEYMKVSSEFNNTKLFIFVNLDSFLTEEDMIELNKFLCYNEIRVLALQNKLARNVISGENLRIIDKDLCEI